jgi:hypothetical protein
LNRFITWNDREMPRCAIFRGARPVIVSPAKITSPRSAW